MPRYTSTHAAIGLAAICLAATPGVSQDVNPTRAETSAFLSADRDRNGKLTRGEFRIFVRAMAKAGQPTARQIKFFGAYDFAFSIADSDGNGVVTPHELRNADDDFRAGEG